MNKRTRLTQALDEALRCAPAAERAELREALADYEATYFRSSPKRAPLLRALMDALRDGVGEPASLENFPRY